MPVVLFFPVFFALVSQDQVQPAHELFEKGLYLEQAHGDLAAAIEVYKKVAAAPAADRPLVAQALLRIGVCHLRSGRIGEARTAFADLARRYPEQKSIIARMRAMTKQFTPTPAPSIKEDKKVRAVRIGKFLTLVLRHDPAAAGIKLDRGGWASIEDLLSGAARRGFRIERDEFDEVVRNDEKQRYEISDDGKRVRARYGHTVPVALGLSRSLVPPRTRCAPCHGRCRLARLTQRPRQEAFVV